MFLQRREIISSDKTHPASLLTAPKEKPPPQSFAPFLCCPMLGFRCFFTAVSHSLIRPSIQPCIQPPTHASIIHPSIHPTIIYPSAYPSIYPPTHPSIRPHLHSQTCPKTPGLGAGRRAKSGTRQPLSFKDREKPLCSRVPWVCAFNVTAVIAVPVTLTEHVLHASPCTEHLPRTTPVTLTWPL